MKVIWYGNDEEAVAKANAEASGSKGEAADSAAEMIKDAGFVMPEVKGRPERSTSVLTYYDKHGKLVKGTSDLGSEYKR